MLRLLLGTLLVLFAPGAVNALASNLRQRGPDKDEKKDDEVDTKSEKTDDTGTEASADIVDGDDPDDAPRIDDPSPSYARPFNLTNGACKTNTHARYIMEIKNVGHGAFYIGKMGFGEPVQTLNMLLDTGSDEIVVKGYQCYGCEGRGYNHNKSATYRIDSPKDDPDNGTEAISYGSGDVWGQRCYDTVSTGPLYGKGMNMLEVRETTIEEFKDTEEDALEVIAGMAPGLPEYTGEKLASKMEVRRFSECLPQNSDENGFFVVNDHDPAENGFSGPFTSMGNYYWAVGVTDFRFQWREDQPDYQEPKKLGATKQFAALVDTGTTLLSVPQSILDDLQDALDLLNYDCAQMDRLPDLKFEIDGVTHTLPPNTYIAEKDQSGSWYRKPDGKNGKDTRLVEELSDYEKTKNLYFKRKFQDKSTGAECSLLFTEPIQMNSTLGEIGILGMPFFRNYIISFDFCSRQIYTKPSLGDCHNAVGRAPTNKKYCQDGEFFGCIMEDIVKLGNDFVDGVASIFTADRPPKSGPRLKYVPGTERFSQAARWLVTARSTPGTTVEI